MDKKRAYLLGIISRSSTDENHCGWAAKDFYITISTTVPGKVLTWIKSFKYTEIKDCLRRNKPVSLTK